jgi:hypothetical protein
MNEQVTGVPSLARFAFGTALHAKCNHVLSAYYSLAACLSGNIIWHLDTLVANGVLVSLLEFVERGQLWNKNIISIGSALK